jgi:XRE family transcriptional regulator, fatty acid utilization regulator
MRQKRTAPKRTVLRLRHLRRAREMSQTALGQRVGLSTPMIAQIEAGERQPSLDNARALAAVFGVSIEALFERVEIAS